ncbi:MAG: aldehyde dehydrogenase family protein, partial [Acidobacteria bacterium]|nr:aldehyde dehydrogenase family protein [Acidobacteriota bacterium]
MPETATKTASIASQFKDSDLFREAAYIDGRWITASKTFPVDNPATGEVIANVPDLGASEARHAIEAANRAFPAWSKKTAKERAVILRKWFDLLLANQEDLAKLMTLEQGKPLTEARGEVAYAAAFIEWFAEEGKRIYGDTIPQHQGDKRIVVI